MVRCALWLVLSGVVAGAACGAWADEPAKPAAAEQISPKVVDANTVFGFGMLKQLVNAGGGKANVVISPASLSLALSMTYNGASGSTSYGNGEGARLYGAEPRWGQCRQ